MRDMKNSLERKVDEVKEVKDEIVSVAVVSQSGCTTRHRKEKR